MNNKKLCQWLRANSSGIYRPAAEAAVELERLTSVVKAANSQAEHFERECYLRGEEIERLRAALTRISRTMSSEWPEHCQANVQIARCVLRPNEGMPVASEPGVN